MEQSGRQAVACLRLASLPVCCTTSSYCFLCAIVNGAQLTAKFGVAKNVTHILLSISPGNWPAQEAKSTFEYTIWHE